MRDLLDDLVGREFTVEEADEIIYVVRRQTHTVGPCGHTMTISVGTDVKEQTHTCIRPRGHRPSYHGDGTVNWTVVA